MKKLLLVLFVIVGSDFAFLHSTTLVYSMRTRRTFAIGEQFRKPGDSIWVISAVPVFQYRKRQFNTIVPKVDVQDKRTIGGVLFNWRVIPSKKWWAEITTGVEREHAKLTGTTNADTARSGVDDIVLSAGRNFFVTEHMQFSAYGIGGLPTRTKVSPIETFGTFVGTRFFSIGAGAEVSTSFFNNLKRTLTTIAQVRFLHAFDRQWDPILKKGEVIQPGNVTDVLLTANHRYMQHIFEIGYNPTIFSNQALLLKTGPVTTDTFVRHSAYVSYTYAFKRAPLAKVPLFVNIGINGSGGHFLNERIVSAWLNLSWVF